ncbi:uncharacterized protein LOC125067165 [Vanessa atalanta]|uniref:uncharacterized protein LOC125067165 n=1 Tax=Vanessa atalanta TaxID=42275 RepID=UPI001FCDB3CA|nr:uncharacterized protein LOC125067165 [Vanessa atalanta]
MLEGFTFAQTINRRYWYCSKRKIGCKARVRLGEDGRIIFAFNQHNHVPPRYHISSKDVLEFVPSNRGKGITLIYKGHTYAHIHTKTRWYCSKKAKGCKARLSTTAEGVLVEVLESYHNHEPPTLYRTNDGKVHRL